MWEILPGIAIFAADQGIKSGDLKQSHHNYGFACNLGSDKPAVIKAVSVLLTAAATVVFVVSLTCAGTRMLRLGLSLLLGGAFSNTYDRVKRGYVIDYLRIPVGSNFIKRLIWNIGDFAIIIGSLICVLDGLHK